VRRHIIVSQRAPIQVDRHFPGLSGREINFREALEFLDKSNYRRIHRSHVQFGGFRSGAFSGISNSKTYPDKVVVLAPMLVPTGFCQMLVVLLQYDWINVEIRVTERRVRPRPTRDLRPSCTRRCGRPGGCGKNPCRGLECGVGHALGLGALGRRLPRKSGRGSKWRPKLAIVQRLSWLIGGTIVSFTGYAAKPLELTESDTAILAATSSVDTMTTRRYCF
jgi:hypothetical protein